MADTNGSTSTQQGDPLSDKTDEEAHMDHETTAAPPSRPPIRALIQDFSPVWFTWCMNTGILSALMHTLPYSFPGLNIIATVLFLIDLTLFILFSIIFSLRLFFYRSTAWTELSSDVNELCFTATLPISWMTLTALTSIIVSNASWGGHAFTLVAYVMWWIGVAWTTLFAIITYALLTQKSLTNAKNLSLAIILPAVATSTVAAEGGLICIYSANMSARLAVPVIIVSFMLVGVGIFIGTLIYGLFLQRMLTTGWFDGIRRPTLILLLGPMGQSSTALLALSTASIIHFPNYTSNPTSNPSGGTFLTLSSAQSLHAASMLFSLLMFGFGVFWLLYGIYGILDAVLKKQTKWTPAWYSTIFPAGTMNSALILFAEAFDSPTFRVLATILLTILVTNVLVNLGFTVRAVLKREILIVSVDPRIEGKKGR